MKTKNNNDLRPLQAISDLPLAYLNKQKAIMLSKPDYQAAATKLIMQASQRGGMFYSQLGYCRLVFPQVHEGAVNFLLGIGPKSLVGHAILVWRYLPLADAYGAFEKALPPQQRPLLWKRDVSREFPWVAVVLSDEFLSSASKREVQLALSAFGAVAFGVLQQVGRQGAAVDRTFLPIQCFPDEHLEILLPETPQWKSPGQPVQQPAHQVTPARKAKGKNAPERIR
jgi:hypothetical protein